MGAPDLMCEQGNPPCGAVDGVRPYLTGLCCAAHTPAAVAGRSEPYGQYPEPLPLAWTRWVLDALGYDQDQDSVDDIFPGSGAVAAAIAQGVLL